MKASIKKWVGKKRPLPAKASKRRQLTPDGAAKDRAERKKIGKSLDLQAFMADFKRDTASAAYWETKE